MKHVQNDWLQCATCGGDIPPETQWGKRGERSDGECPRRQRDDGMCGAFAARERYAKQELEIEPEIADSEIISLSREADAHGDDEMSLLCMHALDGVGPLDPCDYTIGNPAKYAGWTPEQARERCAAVIRDARGAE